MTTAQIAADIDPPTKRQRLAEDASKQAQSADAAADDDGQSLVAVTVPKEQISSSEVISALQRLLSMYQAEYWSLLEDFKAAYSEANKQTAGKLDGTGVMDANATMQQLWAATAADRQSNATKDAQVPAAAETSRDTPQQNVQQEQQQQQPEPQPHSPSPSAAASATPAKGDPAVQDQQHWQQLDVPSLQQAQQLLQKLQTGGQPAGSITAQKLHEAQQRWQAVAPDVLQLEQLASAATLQYLDTLGGLACLCGQHGRWVLRRSAVSLGRSTDAKGEVDIDLGTAAGEAGLGTQVSRLQAQLVLTADGKWSLTNTGRAPVAVNGQQVLRGTSVHLSHLALLEVSGLPLLFMINSLAVQRAVSRSVHLAM